MSHIRYLCPFLTRDALEFIKRQHRTRIRFTDTRGFSVRTDSSLIRNDGLAMNEIIVIQKFAVQSRYPYEKRSFVTDYYFYVNALSSFT